MSLVLWITIEFVHFQLFFKRIGILKLTEQNIQYIQQKNNIFNL